MIESVELQIISKLLTSDDEELIDTLCSYDESYYAIFKNQIHFIFEHKQQCGSIPDVFTFQSEFPDINLVQVSEPLEYLENEIKKNKQTIILRETFNKLKDLGSGDVTEAWSYLAMQCDAASKLNRVAPMDIIQQADERSKQVIEYAKQTRIPTGFPEIDKTMYGGLSTIEELLILLARTNSGKSWCCAKIMESAQRNGFPVAYYSPEMQAAYLATRFDTWRGHFQNSELFQGHYTDSYVDYIKNLPRDATSAFVIEDKDMPDGVSVKKLEPFIKKNGIKLLMIDGLSYMIDDQPSQSDYDKYKHIATDLFKLSKKYGCAVVIVMQANRVTGESRDDKGEPFPTLYNAEGSDHPGRICTQAFSIRQIFDRHVLDIRMEKSRNANNQKPIFSYAIDFNTGNMQYLPEGDDGSNVNLGNMPAAPTSNVNISSPVINDHNENDLGIVMPEFEQGSDDDIEF